MEIDEFLAKQDKFVISYSPIKQKIKEIISTKEGDFGMYFEDLVTGSWVGINERDSFFPASLLKLPVLASILKKIERGELELNDTVIIMQSDLDPDSGNLYKKGAGSNISINELIRYLANESDNTALNALQRKISQDEFFESVYGLGISDISYDMNDVLISPKGYSNAFRSLWLSTYLRRPFSNYALSLMQEERYGFGIESGVPNEIKISHKIGIWRSSGIFHDCGIIYFPKTPYLLCIMSKNTTEYEAMEAMSEISYSIFQHVQNMHK